MDKKHIGSLLFLFISLVIFLFILIVKVPDDVNIIANFNIDLPLAVIYTLSISHFVISNLLIILVLVLLYLAANMTSLVSEPLKVKYLFPANIVISVILLLISILSYAEIEKTVRQIASFV